MEKAKPEKTTKVRVSGRWRVVHDGTAYVHGDTVTVPQALADEWIRSGWVERVTTPPKK